MKGHDAFRKLLGSHLYICSEGNRDSDSAADIKSLSFGKKVFAERSRDPFGGGLLDPHLSIRMCPLYFRFGIFPIFGGIFPIFPVSGLTPSGMLQKSLGNPPVYLLSNQSSNVAADVFQAMGTTNLRGTLSITRVYHAWERLWLVHEMCTSEKNEKIPSELRGAILQQL